MRLPAGILITVAIALGGWLLTSHTLFPPQPIKIASHVWPGYELMFLARKEGWLPGDLVQLTETGSATDSIQALADDTVDGAALTLDETLRARGKGIPLSVVLVFDVSAGADKVIAREDINTLKDLAGKRIGLEQSALGALMLNKTLNAAGLSVTQVHLVPTNFDHHLDAWRSGQLDALITFDPIGNQLLQENARLLFDSRKLPNTILDVLAIKPAALKRNPEAVKALIAAHFQALEHLRQNPQDAVYRLADRLNVGGHEVLNNYRGIELPDLNANYKLLNGSTSPLLDVAKELSKLMAHEQFIPHEDNLEGLTSAQFLSITD